MSENSPDLDKLREALVADRARRVQSVEAEIKATLARHRCELSAIPVFVQDGKSGFAVNVEIQIIAVDKL